MGRPPLLNKIDPSIISSLCDSLIEGNYLSTACESMGLNYNTVDEWLRKGSNKSIRGGNSKIYKDFTKQIKKSQAIAEAGRLKRIDIAGKGGQLIEIKVITKKDGSQETIQRFSLPQWQADAWFLERTRPDKFGQRPAQDINIILGQQNILDLLDARFPDSLTASKVKLLTEGKR